MTVSLRRLLASDAPAAVWLIRLLIGAVFVSEGIQKFLFPAELGVGRFTKIGLPSPEVLAPFVGVVEIVGGLLLLLGLCTRLAAVALIIHRLRHRLSDDRSHAITIVVAFYCPQSSTFHPSRRPQPAG